VEPRRQGYPAPPALGPQRPPVEPVPEQQSRLGDPQPRQQGGQRRLAAPGSSLKQDAGAVADDRRGAAEDRFTTS
jgi:hypothetical protein